MRTSSHLFLLMAFALTFCVQAIGQQQIEVSGQVKDEQTKENLPYTKVVALTPADSLIGGGITDENGFFRLPIDPGVYKFVISTYGYQNDTIAAGLLREDKFLGVVRLKSDLVDIDEVKVSASSRVDLLEKDVQIVTEELKKGSTAAKDVLDRISGISYDEYSGILKVDNDAVELAGYVKKAEQMKPRRQYLIQFPHLVE